MRLATCDFAVFAACSELTRKFLKLPWRTSSFAFCWLTRILMSKNVNIYLSRDPPIVINNVSCLFYWLLRRSNGISLAKNLTTRITPLPCIITVQNQNAIRNVFYCPKKWTKQLKNSPQRRMRTGLRIYGCAVSGTAFSLKALHFRAGCQHYIRRSKSSNWCCLPERTSLIFVQIKRR